MVLLTAALTGAVSIQFIAANWSERTPILQLPESLIAVPLPIGMALIVIFVADRLWRTRGHLAWTTAAFLLLAGIFATTCGDWLPLFGDQAPIIAALILFVVAILAGVPVGFVLLLASTTYLWGAGAISLVVLPQNMVNGTGNYILLAIPFFILAGLVMERGGVSLRLIRFIQALVGHLRGGLLQVTVVSMYIISGLSGSKPADVAAVGTVMRDRAARASRRAGRRGGAGFVRDHGRDGAAEHRHADRRFDHQCLGRRHVHRRPDPCRRDGLCLAALIHVRATRAGAPLLPRASLRVVVQAGLGAVAPALMPGLLLAGILSGVATPTEIAALAVVYGLFLAMAVYREMGLRDFVRDDRRRSFADRRAAVHFRRRLGLLLDA